MTTTAPVDPSLFASLDPVRLRGSRCTDCGTTTFPVQADCPRCARRTMEPVTLPDQGTLWTWTVQSFEPRPPYVVPPMGFEPFAVGYVDLGDVIVESRLATDPSDLHVGMRMVLVPWAIADQDAQTLLGYVFAPATSSETSRKPA